MTRRKIKAGSNYGICLTDLCLPISFSVEAQDLTLFSVKGCLYLILFSPYLHGV